MENRGMSPGAGSSFEYFRGGALSGSNDLPQACLKMSKSGGALPQLLLLWNKNDGKDDMNQRLADVLDHTYPALRQNAGRRLTAGIISMIR